MKVLVSGSSGFIGQHVAASLAAGGHEVVPFDHPRDVCDYTSLLDACQDVDGIINLAGQLGTTELLGAEHTAAEVNILGAINVYDVGKALDIPVVQIGTGHKGQPNTYAITKAAAEDLALARAQWTGAKITVVRAFHVYGPGQKACPPHGHSQVRKIMPSFLCRALTGMPLQVYGSGEQVIDLVHVADVADVLVGALWGPYGTVIQAGTGKPVTVLQAAEDVLSAVAPTGIVEHLPMRPGEPEAASVVADAPSCPNPWPYKLLDTALWYREMLDQQEVGHGAVREPATG